MKLPSKTPEIAYIEDNEELRSGCDPSIPNLSIGDYFLTASNPSLSEFKKKNKTFILAISDSTCDNCCKGEIMLKSIQDLFTSGDLSFKSKFKLKTKL